MDFPLKRDILLLDNITDTNTLKYTGSCYQHRDAEGKLLSLHHFFLQAEWGVLYYCMGKSSLGAMGVIHCAHLNSYQQQSHSSWDGYVYDVESTKIWAL